MTMSKTYQQVEEIRDTEKNWSYTQKLGFALIYDLLYNLKLTDYEIGEMLTFFKKSYDVNWFYAFVIKEWLNKDIRLKNNYFRIHRQLNEIEWFELED